MGLIDKIKNDVKKSGSNKGKIVYIKDGTKLRVRFLTDMDDGMEVTFHDKFDRGINLPCREHYGKPCHYCEDEDLRTRSQYVWSVYNYETKEVQLLVFPVNSFSPIPALVAMYENYGTLTDRDYVISRTGKQTNTSYTVIPMEKVKFRNEKAKAYSKNQILKILDKAYPDTNEDDDDYEDEPKKKPSTKSKKKEVEDDEDEDELPWITPDEKSDSEYENMSPKELYKLCNERDIEAEPKKTAKYYINLLKEDDKANDDWGDGDDDDDDEWEDE